MNFRSEIDPGVSGINLRPPDGVGWIGSCFARHISHKLSAHGFDVSEPSHGILFHPLAMAESLNQVLTGKKWTREDLIVFQNRYHSLAHHGSFSSVDPDQLIESVTMSSNRFRTGVLNARCLLVTLGTAKAWMYQETGVVVGNCHKLPASRFTSSITPYTQIAGVLGDALLRLHQANPGIQIVISVSPVRHWRDGFAANQISKAHLILASHQLTEAFDFIHYFPAYELFMDDLRDYRFYDRDLMHPSEEAIDYVWEKFSGWAIHPKHRDTVERIGRLSRIFQHRPSDGSEQEHEQRVSDIRKEIEQLIRGIQS